MLKNNLPAGVFYVPAYELYDHSDWSFDPVKISTLKDKYLSIIDYSTENYNDTVPEAYDYFKKLDINFILLSHNPRHHLLHSNLLFYPHWLEWSREELKFPVLDQTAAKSHRIASMSRSPKVHRIINYILLKNKSYFDPEVITAHQDTYIAWHLTRPDDMAVPPEIKTQWDEIYESLPKATIAQLNRAVNVVHPGYTDSYVHLIVETAVTKSFFMSEKTWQPVASGQLFLTWGSAGSIGHLRDLGVDVFDDIVDHKYYDIEQDPMARLHKIHMVLDDLAVQDLEDMHRQTLTRRESNVANFKNGLFGKNYQDQLTTCINMLN
jgi:hypothetical protein